MSSDRGNTLNLVVSLIHRLCFIGYAVHPCLCILCYRTIFPRGLALVTATRLMSVAEELEQTAVGYLKQNIHAQAHSSYIVVAEIDTELFSDR